MQATQGHFVRRKDWKECYLYRKGWIADSSIRSLIRSVSGWTKEYFGYPTDDWFKT